jgi:NhaP-type Na+/H+ or K+/H+ antiporter
LLFEEYFHRNALAVILMPLLFLAGTGSFWKRTKKNWVDYLCAILWIMFAIMIAIGGWFHWWLCWLFLSVSTVVFALLERLLKRRDTKKAQLGDPQS